MAKKRKANKALRRSGSYKARSKVWTALLVIVIIILTAAAITMSSLMYFGASSAGDSGIIEKIKSAVSGDKEITGSPEDVPNHPKEPFSEDYDPAEEISYAEDNASQNSSEGAEVDYWRNQPSEYSGPEDESVLDMEVVRWHDDNESCYTVIEGNVYNLTGWIEENPQKKIFALSMCGAIATELYNKRLEQGYLEPIALEDYLLGELVE